MTKQEFIKELKKMVSELENDSYHYIDLESGYLFANRNYGEVNISLAKGTSISVILYNKKEGEEA